MHTLNNAGIPKMVSETNPAPTRILLKVGVARQLTAAAASANMALTVGCKFISVHANGAAIRFSVGSVAQTATAASHFVASGERLDIALPDTANIAAIRDGTVSGVLEITELA